jgi:hypothetical protein
MIKGMTDADDEDRYRPDPDRETAMVIDGYYQALARAIGGRAGELGGRVRARAAELEVVHRGRARDPAAGRNLRLGCAVLAAREELAAVVPAGELVELLTAAFVESGAWTTPKVKAWLDGVEDPFRAMVAVSKQREEEDFGATFAFRRARDDDEAYLLDVERCFWHDLFGAAGHPELTQTMCAFDRNWFGAIDPDRHGFRFERATTLGLGGDHCPFHFIRIRPPDRRG